MLDLEYIKLFVGAAYDPDASPEILRLVIANIPGLVAEIERLRGLLAPLVAEVPVAFGGTDNACCAYCAGSIAYAEEHAPDCPWLLARDGLAHRATS